MTSRQLKMIVTNLKEGRISRREKSRLAEYIPRLERRAERAEGAALTDKLTGLPNARAFWQDYRLTLKAFREDRSGPLALIGTDLEEFKNINDTYGELAGDAALRFFAEEARTLLRRPPCGRRHRSGHSRKCGCSQRDRRSNDQIYRRGGDEFFILVPNVRSNRQAEAIAGRFRRSFEFSFSGLLLRFSARAVSAISRRDDDRDLEALVSVRLAQLKSRR